MTTSAQHPRALLNLRNFRNRVCVQPPTSAVDVTLSAFTAECRAAGATAGAIGAEHRRLLSIDLVSGALSSKPAGGRCCCETMGQTSGVTIIFGPPAKIRYGNNK